MKKYTFGAYEAVKRLRVSWRGKIRNAPGGLRPFPPPPPLSELRRSTHQLIYNRPRKPLFLVLERVLKPYHFFARNRSLQQYAIVQPARQGGGGGRAGWDIRKDARPQSCRRSGARGRARKTRVVDRVEQRVGHSKGRSPRTHRMKTTRLRCSSPGRTWHGQYILLHF